MCDCGFILVKLSITGVTSGWEYVVRELDSDGSIDIVEHEVSPHQCKRPFSGTTRPSFF